MTITMHNNTIFYSVVLIPNVHPEFDDNKFYEIRHSKGTSLINKDMIEIIDIDYNDMQHKVETISVKDLAEDDRPFRLE